MLTKLTELSQNLRACSLASRVLLFTSRVLLLTLHDRLSISNDARFVAPMRESIADVLGCRSLYLFLRLDLDDYEDLVQYLSSFIL